MLGGVGARALLLLRQFSLLKEFVNAVERATFREEALYFTLLLAIKREKEENKVNGFCTNIQTDRLT